MVAEAKTIKIAGSVFFAPPHTMKQYQARSHALLMKLRAIDPSFMKLAILGQAGFIPLEEDLSDLDEKIRNELIQGNTADFVLHRNEVGPGALTLNRIGFSLQYFAYDRSPNAIDTSESLRISIRGNSAGAEPHGSVALSIPLHLRCKIFERATVHSIVTAIASEWDLNVVGVCSPDFEEVIAKKGDLYSGQWMTYYRIPDLKNCLPEQVTSHVVHDGLLVETTPCIPDPHNAEDVAAGERTREVLDSFGLVWHSQYAIHGWPPDEEEWRYEEFISGAPRGRKYRVRCIDFDGYDAQRNVLLYAKLFRQLRQQRKEWGLRGWDGPVLNEAKRQVHAAKGMQIEWHIGLEEPAARVRTLLVDYTDFKDHQLRVIYTPLSQALG